MINLNECKFGDRLRTKSGEMAVFLCKFFDNHEVYICAISYGEYCLLKIKYLANGRRYDSNNPPEFDIVSKWEDKK